MSGWAVNVVHVHFNESLNSYKQLLCQKSSTVYYVRSSLRHSAGNVRLRCERKRVHASVTSPTARSINSVIQIWSLVFDVSFQFVDIRDLRIRAGCGHVEYTVYRLCDWLHAFSYSSLVRWNSIPTSIKNCSSLYSFKRHLKSHLRAQLINN